MIACDCAVCRSENPRNKRGRASVHVVMDGLRIQVDAGPEFRLQCVRENIREIDLFVLTHGHADHIAGMDDLRRFCGRPDLPEKVMPIYTTDEGMARVKAMYPYAMEGRPVAKGYPAFRVEMMPLSPEKIELEQGSIEATLLPHGWINTLGLVFTERSSGRKFAYYTDCKSVTEEAMRLAADADLVVLDGLRQEPHPTHMSVSDALEVARTLKAPQTLLTHMTHNLEHDEWCDKLPQGVSLAWDGLRVDLRKD